MEWICPRGHLISPLFAVQGVWQFCRPPGENKINEAFPLGQRRPAQTPGWMSS